MCVTCFIGDGYMEIFSNEFKASEFSKMFWNEWQIYPDNKNYNFGFTYNLIGVLDIGKLELSIKTLINRNPILRSTFYQDEDGELYQRINANVSVKLEYKGFTQKTDQVVDYLNQFKDREYDLTKGNLFRFLLIKEGQRKYKLLVGFHHIIFDGVCSDLVIKEIAELYNTGENAEAAQVNNDIGLLSEFLIEEEQNLAKLQKDKAEQYFLEKIRRKNLFIDFNSSTGNKDYRSEELRFTLKPDEFNKLKEFSSRNQTSSFSIICTVFGLLIAKYFNITAVPLAYPVNMRRRRNKPLKGAYINILPLMLDFQPESSFIDILNQIKTQLKKDLRYRCLPWHEIVKLSRKEVNAESKTSFFNVSITENHLLGDCTGLQIEGMKTSVFARKNLGGSDLGLEYGIENDDILLQLNYKTNLFDISFIEQISNHFLRLLSICINDPEITSSETTLLTEQEYQTIVYDWNKTEVLYPDRSTLHALFEEQAIACPDNVALVFGDKEMTYLELNEKANQLAYTIRHEYDEHWDEEVKGDTLIGIYIERSFEMIIAILGILKSGAAYVPFDPVDPEERLKFKVNDCGCRMVLTSSKMAEDLVFLSELDTLPLSIDSYWSEISKAPKYSPVHINSSVNLAYVIYTSGSTGKPKGVIQPHYNVIRLFNTCDKHFSFTKSDIWTLFHSYSFDFSVWEIWGALLYGAKLIIPTYEQTHDTALFYDLLQKYDVTVLNQTPSAFYQLIDTDMNKPVRLDSLRYVIFGGEALNISLLKKWSNKYGCSSPALVNMYGITETTVHVTCKLITEENLRLGGISNIGKRLGDLTCYVLDENMNPVPVGISGELYVGGNGLACGYLNRNDLTRERFIDNPFVTEDDAACCKNLKLYKTGDVVRYLSSGELEYIGRNDCQVQLHGFRIELGEIESILLNYSDVLHSVIEVKEKYSNKYLVAYYVSEKEINEDVLRKHLLSSLPEYMVPNIFVRLKALPLTPNGKLDRKALPDPEFSSSEENYLPPTTDMEKQFAAVWEELLGLEKVGITDDFFKLGGDSIISIQLTNKASNQLGVHISVADVFKHKTIKNLLSFGLDNKRIEITKSDIEEYPLSFAQERLFFIDEYEGGTNAYNIPIVLELSDSIDTEKLKQSITQLVETHDILRTVIKEKCGKYIQVVSNRQLNIEELNIDENNISSKVELCINILFKLKEELPIKVWILNRELVIINIHHIAFDGWSTDIFLRELDENYKSLIEGRTAVLPEQKISYRDFAVWQREYLQGDVLEKQKEYWKNQLTGYENVNLPLDKVRPSKISYEGDNEYFEFSDDLTSLIRTTVKEKGVTLNIFLLSCFNILLSKYCGQDDIVVGTPTANRHYKELENIIGFFVNSLVIRTKINSNETTGELIEQINNTMIGSQLHQDIPFEKVVGFLNVEKDLSRSPVFQVMFGVQSFCSGINDELFKPSSLTELYKISKFDLSLFIDDSDNKLRCTIEYAVKLFNQSTIKQITKHFKRVVEQVVSNSDVKIKNINLMSDKEYQAIVYDWNQTDAPYPKDKTIHQLFEEQAERTPDNIAVVFEDAKLSYKELSHRANQLAHTIRKEYRDITGEEVKGDTLIGIYIERSFEMIIGILGILKSGAAYVPFDSADPEERLKFKINDCGCKMVLTSSKMAEDLVFLTELDTLPLSIDSYWSEIAKAPISTPKQINKPTDLAYIIYTSGSTGKPKGTMIEHGSLVNRLLWMKKKYRFNEKDKILQKTPYSFDVSVWELILPSLCGSALIFAKPEGHKDPEYLAKLINSEKITKLHFVPSMLYAFINYLSSSRHIHLNTITDIICSGEALDTELSVKTTDLLQHIKLHNLYGPTEATIDVSYHEFNEGKDTNITVPIGKPIQNYKLYILDENLYPVPIGVAGELYISGIGLARGYLRRPDLTSDKFVNNPFSLNSKMYKTGDLCRYLPDGNIEFIGRNDFQIKIRGFRIELGEIESKLLEHPEISQCTVSVFRNKKSEVSNQKYIVAYYVSVSNQQPAVSTQQLADFLSAKLPEYMVPSVFVRLDGLPITPNGKLDRNALPDPEFTNKENYVPPTTDIEKQLVIIWEDLLGLPKVGITDDFFRLGGDSIISIQLTSRLRKIDIHVNVKDIFECRTIKSILKFIANEKLEIVAEHGILEGNFNLLPVQQWFFEREFNNPNYWNQAFLIKTPELNIDKLQEILQQLIEHHDILRITFIDSAQKYNQTINIPELKTIDTCSLSEEELFDKLTSLQNSFDIKNGPLCNIAYLHGYPDGSARIFFAAHHLIIDAVSWRILTESIRSLYEGNSISTKTSSYRQWTETVKEYAEANQKEKAFWNNVIEEYIEITPEISQHYTTVNFNKETTENLLNTAGKAYHTEINDLLLSALSASLLAVTGKNSNYITLEGHGREHLFDEIDLSETVGWFTTMYPVKLDHEATLSELIKNTKENLRNIPNKGIGYSALGGKVYPNISFNYLGQFDSKDGFWQIVDEASGISLSDKNHDSNVLNINGMISDSRLSFSIGSQLSKEKTKLFKTAFKESLEEVVNHCVGNAEKGSLCYTPSDFETVSISRELLDRLQKDIKIEAIYPANSLQQGFIYHVLSNPEDDAYRVQLLFDYSRPINAENYKKAWLKAVETYPILRTSFNWDEELIQIIHKSGVIQFFYHDISNKSDKTKATIEIQEKDRLVPFDLTKAELLRIHLIKQTDNLYTVLKSDHHAIADGWSGPVLLNKVHEYYQLIEHNRKITVRTEDTYLLAQKYMYKHKSETQIYWQNKMSELDGVNDLTVMLDEKIDLDNIKELKNSRDKCFVFDKSLTKRLIELSKENGITLNVILLFAWHKLISVYTRDLTTVVGTTIAGRSIPVEGIDKSVGLYINTLPLIVNWEDKTTIEQLKLIHRHVTDMNNNSYMNLSELQDSGKRLFHSLFVYENYPMDNKQSNDMNLTFRNAIEKLDYPLCIIAYQKGDELTVVLKYSIEYLKETSAEKLLNKLEKIAQEITDKLDKSHKDINLLYTEEYQAIVYDWNQTDAPYPKDKTIHQLFEEQAERTPDNIAVVFEDAKLSYKELSHRANQLAHTIRKEYRDITGEEVKGDTLIGIYIERSFEMIIGILGILKSGAAYVPFDSADPEERLKFKINDCGCKMVLTSSKMAEDLVFLTELDTLPLSIDSYWSEIAKAPISTPKQINKPTDLAYIIYTSGSTGKPKGTMIEHGSLVNRLLWMKKKYRFNEKDKILQKTPYSFDVSVWELILPSLCGSALIFAKPEGHKDPEYLAKLINSEKITKLHFVPSMLYAFINYLSSSRHIHLNTITDIICSGEALDTELSVKTTDLLQHIKLHNLYGPTEATIDVSYHEFNEGKDTNITVPIGKPIQNYKLYILDENLYPVPIGVAGELYISGIGLARGYLRRPDLTSDKFVNNPFSLNSKMYKTGDLCRYLPDGNIEFIGRNDFQIKIHGFRIELGEIESNLLNFSNVSQAVVEAKEKNGNKYLVGYYVLNKADNEQHVIKEQKGFEENIREYLSGILPEYMVPSVFVRLDGLPITPNGKLDRNALPDPEFTNKENYVPPTTDIEKQLVVIWEDLLGLPKVGITDDFFRLGGDSIISIQLTSRLRKIDIHVNVKDIFECRTIKSILKFIANEKLEIVAEHGILEGNFNLLPVQQWFFEREFNNPNYWNQAFLIKTPELNIDKLQEILQQLIEHHDILRITFIDSAQKYNQTINIPELKTIDTCSLSEEELFDKLTSLQNSFDIKNGPLCNIAYLHGYPDGGARIFFAAHHLIIDAVSWRILTESIRTLYEGNSISAKTSSYRQWTETVKEYAEANQKEKAFWNNVIEEYIEITPEISQHYTTVNFNKETTENLLNTAGKAYHTEINDLLLSALSASLLAVTGKNSNYITLEGHGREHLSDEIDLSETVGWFTTMYPVKLDHEATLSELIKNTKENLRNIPNKGIGYSALGGKVYPNISFNYLGQFDSKDGFWQIVDEASGISLSDKNHDSNVLNINGMISDSRLSFSIGSQLSKEKTKLFKTAFKESLEEVVNHCVGNAEKGSLCYTPSDFETVSISRELLDRLQKDIKIEAIYPANSLQQGFIYHVLSNPEDDAYRVQLLFDYSRPINAENYKKAWLKAVETYPILRTSFNWDEELIQIIHKSGVIQFFYHDISNKSDKTKATIEIQEKDRLVPFDLTKAELLRIHLIKQTDNLYTVLKSDHHAIVDGWSGPVLLNKVHEYFQLLEHNRKITVRTEDTYLLTQKYMYKHKSETQIYWQNKMSELDGVNDLTVMLDEKVDLDNIKELKDPRDKSFVFDKSLTKRLIELSKENGITLNVILLFAWHKLISAYARDTTTVVGTTVAGRSIPVEGIDKSVGLYINTLPLIINWEDKTTIEQLKLIHRHVTDMNNNSYMNLSELQDNGERLFHSLFVYENYPVNDKQFNDMNLTFRNAIEKLDYPLGIAASLKGDELTVVLKYSNEYLKKPNAVKLLNKLEKIAQEITDKLDKSHRDINLLSAEEYQSIVYDWNRTEAPYPKDKTIHSLFEEQVVKTPENIAVSFSVDYSDYHEELNNNKLTFESLKLLNCYFKLKSSWHIHDKNFPDFLGGKYINRKDNIYLTSHDSNYLVMNKDTYELLYLFKDGAYAGEIYDMVHKQRNMLIVCSILINSKNSEIICRETDYYINNRIYSFIAFLKNLYVHGIIEFCDINNDIDYYNKSYLNRVHLNNNSVVSDNNFKVDEKEFFYKQEELILEKGNAKIVLFGDTIGDASVGLVYLASYLRRNDIDAYCQLFDLNSDINSLEGSIKRIIDKYLPEYIGISMKWFPHIGRVIKISEIIRAYSAKIKIVIGGNSASYYYEDLIKYSCFDYIVRGDGEKPILSICKEDEYLPNTVYKKNGRVITNPIEYIQNKENSSEVYLSHLDKVFVSYLDYFSISSSFFIPVGKGCSMNCLYCGGCRTAQKKCFGRVKPFMRETEEVRYDILAVKDYTSKLCFDFDIPITGSLKYYKAIWDGIDLANHFSDFYFWKLPDSIFLELISKTFKESTIKIDMCSLSERHRLLLSSMNIVKPQPTDKELLSVFDEAERYNNIKINIDIISGLPYFTQEDVEISKEMITYIKGKYTCFSGLEWGRLHAQPGAPIVEDSEKYNMHSYATGFQDFLNYSQKNIEEEIYPDLSTCYYPFIYYDDNELNSKISGCYAAITSIMCEENYLHRINLKYNYLNEKSNQLAYALRNEYRTYFNNELFKDTVIGIFINRGIEIPISIMAILKSGAAYAFFDVNEPDDRLSYKISDSGCKVILTMSEYADKLSSLLNISILKIEIDSKWKEINRLSKSNPGLINECNDLAYIIYTSGSTGQPKGTMLEHKGVLNLVHSHQRNISLSKKTKFLQYASNSFDASVSNYFCSLLFGGSLYICNEKQRKDSLKLIGFILKEGIDVIDIPAKLLENLPRFTHIDVHILDTIITAGEVAAEEAMDYWCGHVNLINAYGPTEATVCSTLNRYERGNLNTNIGKPIFNVQTYILDTEMHSLPVGAVGELYIGGAGLARGYLNRTELTKECFVSNPFATEEDISKGYTKLYKTGDLCRYLSDGNIDYIGRSDFQLKIRGFRIEPGEIESVLLKYDDILQAVVVAKEKNENKYLAGYYVGEETVNKEYLRQYLSSSLPEYMVPDVLVKLSSIPLTTNGKLDRKALPDPEFSAEGNYVPPTTDMEKQLAAVWGKLLGLDEVGITDDFFRMGGNSILSIQLSNKISKQLNIHVSVADVFKHKTIRNLLSSGGENKRIEITKSCVKEYPLSFGQERLFFIDVYEGGTNAYNSPMILELSNDINIDKLKRSITQLVERHDILRTVIKENSNEYIQVLIEDALIIQEEKVEKAKLNDSITGYANVFFDLSKELPIKVWLLNSRILIINIHHIAFDGWSADIFLRELKEIYKSFVDNRMAALSEQEISYRDFAVWQRGYLQGSVLEMQKIYWRNNLAGYENINLPLDKPRPLKTSYKGDNFLFELSEDLTAQIKNTAEKRGITLNTLLLACFNILLSKYSGQDDIVVGTPIANRHYKELENVIGFFVNTLAVRTKIDSDVAVKDLIEQVNQTMIESQQHQDIPFEKVVDLLDVEKDLSRSPIFQVMFGVQSFGRGMEDELFKPYPLIEAYKVSKFDLSLFIDDSEKNLRCMAEYAVKLFNRSTIKQMSKHFTSVVKQVVSNLDIKIKDINLLSPEEYKTIVYDWNQTETFYPNKSTLHTLFEEQVAKTPEKTALVFEEKEMTYRELNEKANQLAHCIRKVYNKKTGSDLKPDTLIPICVDRCFDMIIGIIGILKSGGAYVPIDPDYPIDRIKFMLQDTGGKILLTQTHIKKKLCDINESIKHIILDKNDYINESKSPPEQINKPTDLAYCIFTSGTTGIPKGVLLEHSSNVNKVCSMIKRTNTNANDTYLFKTNYIFDVSFTDIFCQLLSGAKLIIAKNEFEINEILNLLTKSDIAEISCHFVPSQFTVVEDMIPFKNIKKLYFSGESLSQTLINSIPQNIEIYNFYGPTETGEVTVQNYKQNRSDNDNNIGRPLCNTQIYILNSHMCPVPIGVSGELYLGGAGLAREYLHRPELTKERFVANPFATKEEVKEGYTRLYKTGDVCRYLPDGNIEFIGRNDSQVKIRGFRIELGEIESAILNYSDILQAVIDVKEKGGNKYIAGYYTTQSSVNSHQNSGLEGNLKTYLSEKLPDYMVPDIFVKLESIPLTPNGKLDRKALPDPEFTTEGKYVAPTTDLERQLSVIWEELLGLEKVGITDDFFSLGGNSILSMRMFSIIRQKLNINVTLMQIHQNPTIENIVNIINKKSLAVGEPHINNIIQDISSGYNLVESSKTSVNFNRFSNPEGVLLTGVTGFLGKYLLISLLENTKADIYCLIRGKNPAEIRERLLTALKDCGKSGFIDNPRIKLIKGDLSEYNLGLSSYDIKTVYEKVNKIYHNGAFVHHIYNYDKLRDENVKSTLFLLKIALKANIPKDFHFISTNLGHFEYSKLLGLLKVKDCKINEYLSHFNGYGLTKLVSETILDKAMQEKMAVTVYRPGNITGDSATGYSNYQQNHLLLFVKGCIQMGAIPNTGAAIEMTPVDTLANSIIKLSLEKKYTGKIIQLDNPYTISITEYIDELNKYNVAANIKIVSHDNWIKNYLSKIKEDNAMFPLKELYLNPKDKFKIDNNFKKLFYPNKELKELGIGEAVDYKKIIERYSNYLLSEGFFTEIP